MNGLDLTVELYVFIKLSIFYKAKGMKFFFFLFNPEKTVLIVYVHQILQTAINAMMKWKRLAHVLEKNFWVQFLALLL